MMHETERRYELEDPNGRPLAFIGRELAHATTQSIDDESPVPTVDEERGVITCPRCGTDFRYLHGNRPVRGARCAACHWKPRWLEYRVYRTRAGSYVLETVGQTVLPSEVVRSRARVLHSAQDLVETLHSRDDDGTKYITYAARDVLDAAMEHDDAIADAWEARVQTIA